MRGTRWGIRGTFFTDVPTPSILNTKEVNRMNIEMMNLVLDACYDVDNELCYAIGEFFVEFPEYVA